MIIKLDLDLGNNENQDPDWSENGPGRYKFEHPTPDYVTL